MKPAQLNKLILDILEEHKAENVINIEVRKISSVTDYMTICSATSARHIKALANHIVTKIKEHGIKPLGTEGWDSDSDWMVLDYGSTIVHIMLPHTRDYYYLEKLWGKLEPQKARVKAAGNKIATKNAAKIKKAIAPKTKTAAKKKPAVLKHSIIKKTNKIKHF